MVRVFSQKTLLVCVCALTMTSATFARRAAVPLLAPKSWPDTPASFRRTASNPYSLQTSRSMQKGDRYSIGFELGSIGQTQTAQSDALGMQMFFGGRAFAHLPIGQGFYLKPALGYFRRMEQLPHVSEIQNNFEAGIGTYFEFLTLPNIHWALGVTQRAVSAFNQISPNDGSASSLSPVSWQYRVGPATELQIELGGDVSLLGDIETVFSVPSPMHTYPGATLGLAFGI